MMSWGGQEMFILPSLDVPLKDSDGVSSMG